MRFQKLKGKMKWIKTRKLTMGILWRRADTELELNEKR